MKTIVIAGGNSGVGLQAAREFLAAGERVIILGRDKQKGDNALASFGAARARAEFLSVDLSTHDGVRDAAKRIKALTDTIDGLVHSAAVFEVRNVRTVDDIPVFVALGYSRYHLTQLLLPELLAAERPRVMMLTATLKSTPKLDPALLPYFRNFNFWTMVLPVNALSLHYADHFTKTHPKIFVGCATPGFVRTDIFRAAPWYFRAFVALTAPFRANSVETAAHNVVQAILQGAGPTARNWPMPGDFTDSFAIVTDPKVRNAVIEASRQVTGV